MRAPAPAGTLHRRRHVRTNRLRAWVVCCACLVAALALLPADPARGQPNNQEPDGKRADVMFVLDVTGSMGFAIEGVEKGLEKVLKKMKDDDIDARVGLTVFRDTANTIKLGFKASTNDKEAGITSDPFTYKFKDDHFTSSSADFRKVLRSLRADGGGDLPENSLEGLKHAAVAPTRNGVSRIMVLITDAEPHVGKDRDKRLAATREALLEHKYHHVYLMCHKDHQGIYQKIWCKDKGHVVNGKWFDIGKDPKEQKAAFDGILEKVSEQASKDVLARRKKK